MDRGLRQHRWSRQHGWWRHHGLWRHHRLGRHHGRRHSNHRRAHQPARRRQANRGHGNRHRHRHGDRHWRTRNRGRSRGQRRRSRGRRGRRPWCGDLWDERFGCRDRCFQPDLGLCLCFDGWRRGCGLGRHDQVLVRTGLDGHIRRANADRQGNLKCDHCGDGHHGHPTADQQHRPAAWLLVIRIAKITRVDDDGRCIGILIRHQAVGQLVAGFGTGKIGDAKVFGHGVRVNGAGARILGVGQRRGR